MFLKNKIKLLSLLFVFALLSACAKQEVPIVSTENTILPLDPIEATKRYEALVENTPTLTPFKAEGSLRFGTQGDTQRVSYLLWANINRPVRLDILSPISTVAMIKEDNNPLSPNLDDVTFYVPSQNILLKHQNTIVALDILSIDIPFNLYTLRKIMQGVFPPAEQGFYFTNAYSLANSENFMYDVAYDIKSLLPQDTTNDSATIEMQDPQMGTWILDPFARPVQFAFQGWELTFSYKENLRNPYKISGAHSSGKVFTIFVNKGNSQNIFPNSAFEITTENDTKIVNLEEQKIILK